jgi:hypothetical protein
MCLYHRSLFRADRGREQPETLSVTPGILYRFRPRSLLMGP